jgi:hypothetical protein
MPPGRSTFPVVMSVIAILLLIAVQVASWLEHRRLNAGAFLLLIFGVAPLFAARRKGKT